MDLADLVDLFAAARADIDSEPDAYEALWAEWTARQVGAQTTGGES